MVSLLHTTPLFHVHERCRRRWLCAEATRYARMWQCAIRFTSWL